MIRISPFFLSVFRIVLFSYFGMVAFLAFGQRRFIYYPAQGTMDRLERRATKAGLVAWLDEAAEYQGWLAEDQGCAGATNIVLAFHGNAGQAVDRDYLARGFQVADQDACWEVYLFEYPGFGPRSGKAAKRHILPAAENALQELMGRGDRLFLLGESLGGGVATHLAGKFPDAVDGVVLLTPFTTLADVARHHFPIFPVRWFLRERYNNVKALKTYRGPLAILVAERDEVVPAIYGKELYEGYDGIKRLWVQPGTHNTLDITSWSPWWGELIEFLMQQEGD